MGKENKMILGVLVVVVIIAGYFIFSRKSEKQNTALPTATLTASIIPMEELKSEDETVGTGKEAVSGTRVTVNYLGTLTDGTKFDSSYDRKTPFTFNLGAGEVIKGWDQGVVGMKVGGKRKLTIPGSLGYGAAGAGALIPPNATLIFDVELLDVK